LESSSKYCMLAFHDNNLGMGLRGYFSHRHAEFPCLSMKRGSRQIRSLINDNTILGTGVNINPTASECSPSCIGTHIWQEHSRLKSSANINAMQNRIFREIHLIDHDDVIELSCNIFSQRHSKTLRLRTQQLTSSTVSRDFF
jgi:hypothetical protein